jgi:hypothetical protein
MVKHEAHPVAVAIDSADALAEGHDQVVQGFEQDVGQDSPLQMAPQSLDQVQTRAVWRQPVDRDPIGIGLEPLLDCACVVEPSVVAHQANLATGVRLDQGNKEDEEIHPTLTVGNCVGDLARRVVDAAVDDLFLVLAGRWDLRLRPHWCPHPRQSRMPMNLHFVLEDERVRSVLLQGFFFNRRNCFVAFA